MCGIVGSLSFDAPIERHVFERMVDALAARGPDGRGLHLFDGGRVALGHRRLAIIDLSDNAQQPMPNEDETVWLVHNGEIYNHQELRKELVERGHRFRSACDSEVILHAYEEWGERCVDRLRGIFAFAIWDAPRARLFLARDHIGVKPLYTWSDGKRFLFASEARALLADPTVPREIDEEAFREFLTFSYVPSGQAIYRQMRKLEPAHWMLVERGGSTLRRYWAPRYRPMVQNVREAVPFIEERLREAVRAQMVSDVPIGVFLSGGIDSSAVAALASSHADDALPSFTIGFEEASVDERPYASLAARSIGTRSFVEVLRLDQALALLPTVVDVYDEPFADASAVPTYAVSRLARDQGIKVVLSGDGGDELFAGYLRYDRFFRCRSLTWTRPFARALPTIRKALGVFKLGELDTYITGPQAERLLGRRFERPRLTRLWSSYDAGIPDITAAQLCELQTYLVDDILTKVDRASMASGVEVRVPLLDLEVVEAAFSVDWRVVFAGGERKALLKQAMSPWLPRELLTRRKAGFGIPIEEWMEQGLHAVTERLVLDGVLVAMGVFRLDGARAVLEERHPYRTWVLLQAELWARRWLEQEDLQEAWARELGNAGILPRARGAAA